MAELFYNRDFTDSTFWGVRFRRARFRDADFSGSDLFHVLLRDVSVDGEIEKLVINGVDVTDFVNQHDRWWPLRNNLSPESVAVLVESWTTLRQEWTALLDRVRDSDPSAVSTSVGGEWSLNETLRHLIFAMDKWFVMPILGGRSFTAIGLPNTSSQERSWSGIDQRANPDFAEIIATRTAQHGVFNEYISTMVLEDLPDSVVVEENGEMPSLACFHVVLEEEFEHLRYMLRDLSELGVL